MKEYEVDGFIMGPVPEQINVAEVIAASFRPGIAEQLAKKPVWQPRKRTPEEQKAFEERMERDMAVLEGFMEHLNALVELYGVSFCGGYGGEVFVQRGVASLDMP